ncbi:MAG: TetR/AcrR family transcriptional regulator [Deltaproteobacteria bacterium]|nr:TetR/AcrR family transcriptional regulator [Deltaproteobacteria bacterium]
MAERSTADTILDVAQNLCQTRGFNAFSYRDIAKELGIKTASIHYHYPTKADLGEALLIRYRQKFASELTKIRAENDDARKQLKCFSNLIESIRKDDKLCLCAMLSSDFESLSPGMKKQLKEFFSDAEAWIEACLLAGKKDGSFSMSKSPKTVAQVFLATLQGMLICSRAFSEDERFENGREALFSMLS